MIEEQIITDLRTLTAKLTDVSINLEKMVAVHEQRLSQHESQIASLSNSYDRKVDMIGDLRREIDDEFEKQNHKITELEKLAWKYGGIFAVVVFFLEKASFVSLLKPLFQ